jgi:hypothetical protein
MHSMSVGQPVYLGDAGETMRKEDSKLGSALPMRPSGWIPLGIVKKEVEDKGGSALQTTGVGCDELTCPVAQA